MTPSIRAAGSDRLSDSIVTAAYCLVGVWTLYLLLAPTTGFSWIESWHNEQRAAQIVLLALTAALFAGLTAFGPDQIRTRLQLPGWWWAFVTIGVVSALVSTMPFAAFAEIALFVLLSTLVVLTAALTMSQPERMAQAARYCALLIAGAHVLAVLVRYVAALHIDKDVDLSVFMLGYANPRFASALYAVVMPFVAAVVINPRERRPLRGAAFASLCLLWTINLGLGTRGIWFAYAIAAPALLLLIGGRQLARVVAALAVTALIGLVVFIALTVSPSAGTSAAGGLPAVTERLQTLTSRDVLWELALNAIVQHPVLGLAPMHFATLKSHVGAHPHNWLLQVAAEWGLIALTILFFGLAKVAKRLRSVGRSVHGFGTEAALAVAAALAYGLVDGNLVMPVSQTAAALALGLALGSLDCGETSRPAPGLPAAAIGTIAIAAAVVVCAYAAQSFPDQPRTTAAFRAAFPRDWLVPRFWEQGLLWPSSDSEAAR
jgi:O-antigen ligase